MAAVDPGAPLLDVRDLVTEFRHGGQVVRPNAGVSLSLQRGRTLGIVGESGSGKSMLCRALLRLVPPPGEIVSGQIRFEGRDLLTLDEAAMRGVRGSAITMIFQNPMTGLNPVRPIGAQITEGLRVHKGVGAREARERGVALMQQVGIPSPHKRYDEYPHQWSGGMLQRAMIAMAMACEPRLLLADEPTTALDVTIQDQILSLLVELQERTDMAMILVSHDMAVVAETCDEVAVMYGGRIVETAPTKALFEQPSHPYTVGLLNSLPHHRAGKRLRPIPGQPPSLAGLGDTCPFLRRCAVASPECGSTPVRLQAVAADHTTACLYPERASSVAAE